MPRQLSSPSPLVQANDLLTDAEQAELSALLDPLRPPASLDDLGHVIRVLWMAIAAFQAATATNSTLLHSLLQRFERVSERVPPDAASIGHINPSQTHVDLWTVARAANLTVTADRLLQRIGAAYVAMVSAQASVNQPSLLAMLDAALAAGKESEGTALNVMSMRTQSVWDQAFRVVYKRSRSQASAAGSLAERLIENRWVGGRSFTNISKMRGVVRAHELTASEVSVTGKYLKAAGDSGEVLALVVSLAHWLGLWVWELTRLEIFDLRGTGLIRLNEDCTCAFVNLAGVLSDLARRSPEGSKKTSDELPYPLPTWMSIWLVSLRRSKPNARTLEDLTGLRLRKSHWKLPGIPAAHVKRLKAHPFVASRAQPLIEADVHQHLIAYACLDWERGEKSSFNYPHVSISEHVGTLAQRANLLSWGALCPFQAEEGSGIGSRGTPLRSLVIELVEARRAVLVSSAAGPNAGWELLRSLHNNFIRYVLLVVTLAWLLRGNTAHGVPASVMRYLEVLGFRDKAVPQAASAPAPLVCGQVVRRQLQFVRVHADALARRCDRLARAGIGRAAPLAAELRRLADGDDGFELLQLIDGDELRPAGAADLAVGLAIGWKFSKDALRHFSTDELRLDGATAAHIELALRHAATGAELFCTSCGVTVREWSIDAERAQDRMLVALGATAMPGLVSTIAGGVLA